MQRSLRPSPFVRDIALTMLTSVVTVGSLTLLTHILAEALGPDKYGAYTLARRALSTIAPLVTIGMGVAVVRYLAVQKDERSRDNYLLSALLLCSAPALVLLVVGLAFKDELSFWLFHDRAYTSLFSATLLLVVTYVYYSLLYALYRGTGHMGRANAWQLLVYAVGPLGIGVAFAGLGRPDLIMYCLALLFSSALIPLGYRVLRSIASNQKQADLRGSSTRLLQYGLPRIPGDFALAALLGIGPFLAPYFASLKDAGYLSAVLSILTIVESAVVAFGVVALPKMSQLTAQGSTDFLRARIGDMVSFTVHLGLFIAIHVALWSEQIVLVLLGNQYSSVTPLMQMLSVALMPYLSYVMLRTVIDAVEVKAINTRNLYLSLLVALATCVLLASLGLGVAGLALGTGAGIFTLGLATVMFLWRVYHLRVSILYWKPVLTLNGALLSIAWAARYWLVPVLPSTALFILIPCLEGLLLAAYCYALWRLRVQWVAQLVVRIVPEVI